MDTARPIDTENDAPTAAADGEADDPARSAARRLYAEEAEPMVRLATVLVGSRHVAEEIVHEAFVKIYPRLPGLASPGGYLRTTVVNLATTHHRRRSLAARLPDPVATSAPAPPLPPDLDEVWTALDRLPERQRQALVLRYYLDLPDREIAHHLQARPGTVRSLISRGLATLAKELAP